MQFDGAFHILYQRNVRASCVGMGQRHGLKCASSAVKETASWVAALTFQRVTTVLVPLLASETLTNLVLLEICLLGQTEQRTCVFTKTQRELPSQSRVLFLLLHRGLQVIFSDAHRTQAHFTVYPDHLGSEQLFCPMDV